MNVKVFRDLELTIMFIIIILVDIEIKGLYED